MTHIKYGITASGLAALFVTAYPARAQTYVPRLVWFNTSNATTTTVSNGMMVTYPQVQNMVSAGSPHKGMGAWNLDSVLKTVNVFQINDTNFASLPTDPSWQSSGLNTWLVRSTNHFLSIAVGDPEPVKDGVCPTSSLMPFDIKPIDLAAPAIFPAFPTSQSNTLFISLDEPLKKLYESSLINPADCIAQAGQHAAALLARYVTDLQMQQPNGSSTTITVIMGDIEVPSEIVAHESLINGMLTSQWQADLETFFSSFSAAIGTSYPTLQCGMTMSSICLEPQLGFFHFELDAGRQSWVSDVINLTEFLRSSKFDNLCANQPSACGGFSGSLTPWLGANLDFEGNLPSLPEQYTGSLLNTCSFYFDTVDAQYVTTAEANMQEYFNSGDVPSNGVTMGTLTNALPDDVEITSYLNYPCPLDSSQSAEAPEIMVPVGVPNPSSPAPTTMYSVLSYFNDYVSSRGPDVVLKSEPPTPTLRFTNRALTISKPTRGMLYGADRMLSSTSNTSSFSTKKLQNAGWQLQFPIGNIYTSSTSAAGATSLVPLQEFIAIDSSTNETYSALSIASSNQATYQASTAVPAGTGSLITLGPLTNAYTLSSGMIGYVFPPSAGPDPCSVAYSGVIPAVNPSCSDISRVPVFQFHRQILSGLTIYAYTTDFCNLPDGSGCPANSQGAPTSEGNVLHSTPYNYTYDGIVFYVGGLVPVPAPAIPQGQPTSEEFSPIILGNTLVQANAPPLNFSNLTNVALSSSDTAVVSASHSSTTLTALGAPTCSGNTDAVYPYPCALDFNAPAGIELLAQDTGQDYREQTVQGGKAVGTVEKGPFSITFSTGAGSYPLVCIYSYSNVAAWSSSVSPTGCY